MSDVLKYDKMQEPWNLSHFRQPLVDLTAVFYDLEPSVLVEVYCRFGGICCPHPQANKLSLEGIGADIGRGAGRVIGAFSEAVGIRAV
jgi:hypothetical protein